MPTLPLLFAITTLLVCLLDYISPASALRHIELHIRHLIETESQRGGRKEGKYDAGPRMSSDLPALRLGRGKGKGAVRVSPCGETVCGQTEGPIDHLGRWKDGQSGAK
ncbi:hypothetical protein K490DRAFT_60959 [Saccharata proteae CBS 121410]|uniref:Uncharacterized protein n=1 Tax=Saccharata proteae CBS 121410 TaxID=1314787 RepID=A0A9P4HYF2_9PEZI|nr:hypothetical protein K490DRAFT_60959 [Saccharata proteae CBS 121410]